ncbi:hypothetical protein ScPMuIL_017542 [Solemya velum]
MDKKSTSSSLGQRLRTLTAGGQGMYEDSVSKYIKNLTKLRGNIDSIVSEVPTTDEPQLTKTKLLEYFDTYEQESGKFSDYLLSARTLEAVNENVIQVSSLSELREIVNSASIELDTRIPQQSVHEPELNELGASIPQQQSVKELKLDSQSLVSKRSARSNISRSSSFYVQQKAKLEAAKVRQKYVEQECLLAQQRADIEVNMKLLQSKRDIEEAECELKVLDQCFDDHDRRSSEVELIPTKRERVEQYIEQQHPISRSFDHKQILRTQEPVLPALVTHTKPPHVGRLNSNAPDFVPHIAPDPSPQTEDIANTDTDCGSYHLVDAEADKEIRNTVVTLQTSCATDVDCSRFHKFSRWSILIRAICVLKHIAKSFAKTVNCNGWHYCTSSTDTDIYRETKLFILKQVQREHFPNEIKCCTEGRAIPKNSSIISLSPFLDENGLLRVGGRLNRAREHLNRLDVQRKMAVPGLPSVVVTILVVYTAFFLYSPMPDDAAEPWKQKMFLAVTRTVNFWSNIGESLGYDSHVNITRSIYWLLSRNTAAVVEDGVDIEDTVFDGVKVRLYKPRGLAVGVPGLVFFHGGGWAFLDPDSYNSFSSIIATEARLVIVSVDYRRSPEHVFPAAHNDCVTATKYFLRNAAKFGVDPKRVGVAGDSAGGNLAMSVVLKITREKDKTLPTIKAQGLLYPLLQGIDFSTPSYRVYGASTRSPSMTSEKGLAEVCGWYAFGHRVNTDKLLLLSNTPSFQKSSARERIDYNLLPKQFVEEVNPSSTKEGNDTFFNEVKHILLDPYFSPLLAYDSDLKRFPKSYVLTTEYDVLRDDGYMVARRLDKNRILVVHRHWPYDGHGLLSLTGYLSNARPALVEFSHFLVENL